MNQNKRIERLEKAVTEIVASDQSQQELDLALIAMINQLREEVSRCRQVHTQMFRNLVTATGATSKPELLKMVAKLEYMDEQIEATVAKFQTSMDLATAMVGMPIPPSVK